MTYLTQGIVLRRDHLSDYDRRYVIYTRHFGKVNATIKSAKKVASKLNSHLDYFCVSSLMLAKGANFERVAAARSECRFRDIAANPYKSCAAFYFCEVADALIKYSLGDDAAFEAMTGFYRALDEAKDKREVLLELNRGCFHLLRHLGYQPVIKSRTQRELFDELHRAVLEAGEKEIRSFGVVSGFLA